MEKDFFLDRTEETRQCNKNKMGDYVLICEKYMQPYASKVSDLTYGKIIEILTRHDHPRGIKVKVIQQNKRIATGRIVYKVRCGKILRK